MKGVYLFAACTQASAANPCSWRCWGTTATQWTSRCKQLPLTLPNCIYNIGRREAVDREFGIFYINCLEQKVNKTQFQPPNQPPRPSKINGGRFKLQFDQFSSKSDGISMVSRPKNLQKVPKNTPKSAYFTLFRPVRTSFVSLLAWESVQTTSQGPNINPWKFQTILEKIIFRRFFRHIFRHFLDSILIFSI